MYVSLNVYADPTTQDDVWAESYGEVYIGTVSEIVGRICFAVSMVSPSQSVIMSSPVSLARIGSPRIDCDMLSPQSAVEIKSPSTTATLETC